MSDDTAPGTEERKSARQLNEEIKYTLYSVFRIRPGVLSADRSAAADEAATVLEQYAAKGVTLRGSYDVSGYRADADVMLWLVSENPDDLQDCYGAFRRTAVGAALDPVWSNMGLHRPAEFNRSHIPAYLAGEDPRRYLCVYPFVRSYEWYVLPPEERRAMLSEHGIMARDFADVRANTVSAFALGDYEWVLAFEADELHRILDLMRDLRATEARRHVREEVPFFTGPRVPLATLVAGLP